MSDYGIKVSKAGVDVKSATGEDLILSSSKNCLKLKDYQSTTINISGGSGSKNLAHGLSINPVVIAFIEISGGYYMFPFLTSNGAGNMYINSTNIVFSCSLFSSDGTYDIYYYISETEEAS